MKEEWKYIKGYENIYQISNLGKIFSCYKNRILKLSINKDGYYQTVLYKKGEKPKHKLVHIIVGLHYVNNPNNKPEINHKDCIKTNNIYSNLEWCDRQENMNHAKENNLIKKEHLIGNKHASKYST
jgi:hypothetical protein